MTAQLSKQTVRKRVEDVLQQGLVITGINRIGTATFHQIEQQKFYINCKNAPDLIAVFFSNPRDARRESLVHCYLSNIANRDKVADFCASKIIYTSESLILRQYFEGETLDVLTVNSAVLSNIAELLIQFQKFNTGELKKYRLDFEELLKKTKSSITIAEQSFCNFSKSDNVFSTFRNYLAQDWLSKVKTLSPGLIHGDLHPKNIVVCNNCFGLVDLSYSRYFYPLFDAASFYIQFIHEYRLSYIDKKADLDIADLQKKCRAFLNTYCSGDPSFDQDCFNLFKLLTIFRGLEYSTAGFRQKAESERKHILYKLFKSEISSG